MPSTRIIFFKEFDGSIPLLNWLDTLRPKRVKAKCIALIQLLAQFGYELHRPHCDTLRDGIKELRTRDRTVNYRLLYFFHQQNCVIISHGIVKEGKVPDIEVDHAIPNRTKYELDPSKHTYSETRQYYEKETDEK